MQNDFQAKYLEMLANSPYIRSVARPGRTIVGLESYTYNAVIGTAAVPLTVANGAVNATLQIMADSDFVMTYLSASINISVGDDMKFNRNVTLQIQDTSTGKFFFNQATVMALVSGAGGFPFVFPAPRLIQANAALQLTAQNRDAGQAYNQMFVALGGTRIFYAGA